jgi:hypothetical protein
MKEAIILPETLETIILCQTIGGVIILITTQEGMEEEIATAIFMETEEDLQVITKPLFMTSTFQATVASNII